MFLPPELITYIFEYYNPNKVMYNIIITHLNSKFNYKKVIKEMRRYRIYNRKCEFMYFAVDSILSRKN